MSKPMDSERLTLDVPTAGRLLGVSRVTAYQLAREGKIPTLKLGKRIVVPKAQLQRMIDGNQETTLSKPK